MVTKTHYSADSLGYWTIYNLFCWVHCYGEKGSLGDAIGPLLTVN